MRIQKPRIKTIIFDLNDVLIIPKKIDRDYEKTFGISQQDFWKPAGEFMVDYTLGKLSFEQFLSGIMKKSNLSKNRISEAKKLHEKNLSLVEGVKELLESLQKRYSLILAAGDGRESLSLKLGKFGLKNYFNEIYATFDIGLIKSDINFYRFILDKNKLNPRETLFIDDQKTHAETAEKLDIHTILFENIEKLKKELKEKFNITV